MTGMTQTGHSDSYNSLHMRRQPTDRQSCAGVCKLPLASAFADCLCDGTINEHVIRSSGPLINIGAFLSTMRIACKKISLMVYLCTMLRSAPLHHSARNIQLVMS